MYRTVDDFLKEWEAESASTIRLFEALTDPSLSQPVSAGGRTLGQIAWHLTLALPDMMREAKLPLLPEGPEPPVPARASEILERYRQHAARLAEEVREGWTDAMLAEEIPMYGESWTRARTLGILLRHEIHHRGQMTIVMRQAGLVVPGLYGPAREEWSQYGMEPQW